MDHLQKAKLQAHLAIFTAAVIYGLNYSIAKDVMPAFIKPLGFILLRAIGATVLFWITAQFTLSERISSKDHFRMAICGFFGVAANQMLFFSGLSISSPISAAVMMTTNPILVLIMSALILKESLRWSRILGIALGIAGAIVLITKGGRVADIFTNGESLGNALVFINALSYAAYLVLVKPLMAKYRAITVIKWVFLYGLMVVIPFGYNQFAELNWYVLPWPVMFKMAFVVICTTYMAYLLQIYALKIVSSTTVSFYVYLQPVIAAVVAIAMGKDSLDAILIFSTIMIFGGVYLVSFYKR